MDTTKLVVGQKVWMRAGDEREEMTVSEITEKYVEVEGTFIYECRPLPCWNIPPYTTEHRYSVRFDKTGKQPNGPSWNTDMDFDFGVSGRGIDASDPRAHCGKTGEPFELTDEIE